MELIKTSNLTQLKHNYIYNRIGYYEELFKIAENIYFSNKAIHMGNVLDLIKVYQREHNEGKKENELKFERAIIRSFFKQKSAGFTDLCLLQDEELSDMIIEKCNIESSSFIKTIIQKVNDKLYGISTNIRGFREINIIEHDDLSFKVDCICNNNSKFKVKVKSSIRYNKNNLLSFTTTFSYSDVFDKNNNKISKVSDKNLIENII